MGWMSWFTFRCHNYNGCTMEKATDTCISEALVMGQADAALAGGFAAAGYTTFAIDDCWQAPQRNATTGAQMPDPSRFPRGLSALADYLHARSLRLGLYTAASAETCELFPASGGSPDHFAVDAAQYSSWGVDALKVDQCPRPGEAYNATAAYTAFGAALEAAGRDVVYACSWPDGMDDDNDCVKPWPTILAAGCGVFRDFIDIQCNFETMREIIEHWGASGSCLSALTPMAWPDMDQLSIGATSGHEGNWSMCLGSIEIERTQMAIWAIAASPLYIGADIRNISAASAAVLLNPTALAVSQDAAGRGGSRVVNASTGPSWQVWSRQLSNGSVAVALYNAYTPSTKAPLVAAPPGAPPNMTVAFADVGLGGAAHVEVFDAWSQVVVGVFATNYTDEVHQPGSYGSVLLILTACGSRAT